MESSNLPTLEELNSLRGTRPLFSSGPHDNPRTPQGELNQIRPLTIEQLSRGYTIQVGCQKFAFSTKDELILKLISYLNNPKETETKWFKGELF